LRKRIDLWKQSLPGITPFYAVKCNNLHPILAEIHKAECGFDCASTDELRRVKAVGSDRIIYANPCKSRPDIQTASHENVQTMTFDSVDELKKIYDEHDNPRPILRIHVDDLGHARIPLNKKFGMYRTEATSLVRLRKPIYGLAFHVGSDCKSELAYKSAFSTVEWYLQTLTKCGILQPEILDIGGGFSGSKQDDSLFQYKIAPAIRENPILKDFKQVIAEPGRFFATQSCSLHTPVIGKKFIPTDGTYALTIDESIYGIFSGVPFDGFKPYFRSSREGTSVPYTIFGRTCDSGDIIVKDALLPSGTQEGDVLEVRDIGAYSYSSASEFNGFPKPKIEVFE
jgi:ornithine decarboxylase